MVALCGSHGVGKDAIAAVLVREAGFVDAKFARPLKDAIRGLFQLDREHVDGALKDVVHPAWGVTPRALMQWYVIQEGSGRIVHRREAQTDETVDTVDTVDTVEKDAWCLVSPYFNLCFVDVRVTTRLRTARTRNAGGSSTASLRTARERAVAASYIGACHR